MPPPWITQLLQQFGISVAVLVAVVAAAHRLGARWLERRIEAGVEEGLQRRLATHQLSLDKEMEGFRSLLVREGDRARSLLTKESTDYSIYAQRRHDAIVRLFDDLLRAEVLATDLSDFHFATAAQMEQSQFTQLTFALKLIPEEQAALQSLFVAKSFEALDARLQTARTRTLRSRVIQARNDASEAYYRSALYLPETVDEAAVGVRDQFHMLIIPYEVVTPESGAQIFANRSKLRHLMLVLQNKARADLSGAAPKAVDAGAAT